MATRELTDNVAPRTLVSRRWAPLTLSVHPDDFVKLKTGEKREFRTYRVRPHQVSEETCGIIYYAQGSIMRSGLVMVEATYVEPLSAISPESVALEGYNSFAEFRAYFKDRETGGGRRGFQPLADVQVVRCRPFDEMDREQMSERLFQRIYGQWA